MTGWTRAVWVSTLLTLASASAYGASDEWPQWRGPDQDGSARRTEVFSRSFDLELAWSRPLGAGYSGIAIAGGRAVTMFSDGKIDWVAAFDVEDGAEIWRVALGPAYKGRHGSEDGPSSTPAIAGGRVYAVGPRGRLLALDLEDGELAWNVDLVAEHGMSIPWYGLASSPLPAADLVYVGGFTHDRRSGLAFAAEDGRLRWSVAGNWLAYQSTVEDRAHRGLLVADGSELAWVDVETGGERFRHAHSEDADLTHPQLVPIDGDKLLLTAKDHSSLYRIRPDSEPPLDQIWRSRDLRDSYVAPVASAGVIYGLSGVFLVAVDARTGERLWKSREPGARNLILVDDQLVLFASSGDLVVAAASPREYRETARISAADRGGYTPPSFAGDRLLVRNTSTLSCVRVVAASPEKASTSGEHPLPPAGAFRDFLTRLEHASNAQALVEDWWADQTSLPLVEDDSVVHFVYRGDATEVALLGDMTQTLYLPEPMRRADGTDLFYRSYRYEPGGLWTYAFLVDLERVILDPGNPLTTAAVASQNPVSVGYELPETLSVLAMPAWKHPAFLEAAESRGRLETLAFRSSSAYRKHDLAVYLPPGYGQASKAFPVIYVLGSRPWLENGHLANAFDNLMGAAVEPAIAVLVPYHKGSWDRMGLDSYTELLTTEIAPLVEARYRTRAPAVLLAAGDDGAAAVAAAFSEPDRFARLALHSPRLKPDEIEKLSQAETGPAVAFVEWSQFEPRIPEENLDFQLLAERTVKLLAGVGTDVERSETATGPGWLSWSSRLDRSLARVLPAGGPDSRARP